MRSTPNSRLKLNEITTSRLWLAVLRRIYALPNQIGWSMNSQESIDNKNKLRRFVGIHKNERCFIMANGPSLGKMDLHPLSSEITFGMNRIYLLFEKLIFLPSYYICVNELVLTQFSSEIKALSMPKFLNWNRRAIFSSHDENTLFLFLRLSFRDSFGNDPTLGLWGGGTVTFVALQLAFYMGFKEVILIGLDHNFTDIGTPNTVETRKQNMDTNHFHPNYFPKGTKWQFPDLRRSEIAYSLARKAYESDGRRIFDATIGGQCPVFEKVDYYSLF